MPQFNDDVTNKKKYARVKFYLVIVVCYLISLNLIQMIIF